MLAGADPDLRRLIDTGGVAATQLRTFLEQNRVELGDLINNLVTTGEVIVKHLDGIKQVLVIYPYVVEGGFTVVSKSPDTGLYDAHFGMIITEPKVCHEGYERHRHPAAPGRRQPADERRRPLRRAGRRRATPAAPRTRRARPRSYADSPVVASYDPETGKLTWGDSTRRLARRPVRVAPPTLGEESWKWLFLQPLTTGQE